MKSRSKIKQNKQTKKYDEIVNLLEWSNPRPTEETFAPSSSPYSKEDVEKVRPKVETSVWTERMLKSLREKSKTGKPWHSLIDKMWKLDNLRSAFKSVKANKGAAGIDHISIQRYEQNLERNLAHLSAILRDGSYRPKAIRRVWIEKPGRKKAQRPIGISTVQDRVAQTALRNVIEPIFEHEFADNSYGFRPQRSTKDALREVRTQLNAGKLHVLDADIQGFFDVIPHDKLMAKVRRHISDSRALQLLENYLKCATIDQGKSTIPTQGTPQGSVISPLLANLYLNDLDHLMAAKGYSMIRYADDFIILCDEATQLDHARTEIDQWCNTHGLTLHPEKTEQTEVSKKTGVDYLGYHFRSHRYWVSKKSFIQIRAKLRPLLGRKQGNSMEYLIAKKLNPILRGMYEYYKHGPSEDMKTIDGWVRMRLRSIKRKQAKRKGRGRGLDHHRYPNAYFAALGLFSLETIQRAEQLSLGQRTC